MDKPKMKLWKKIAIAVVCLIVALMLALIFVGNYFVDFALMRSDESKDVSPTSITSVEDQAKIDANTLLIDAQKDRWLADARRDEAQIITPDSLMLRAAVFYAPQQTDRWLLAVHGYNSKKESMWDIASAYGLDGWNVLSPDMRAHGESDGQYIGMGWLDRLDILQWIDYITSLDPDAEIVLHGVSMGAATVMMTSAEDLSSNVKVIIEDCGYTSVWDIFEDELAYLYGLPDFPILPVTEAIAKVRAGYGFQEASALEQVRDAKVPILFIHGSADNFVSTDMVYPLYEACPTPKDILIIEGAGHAESYDKEPALYYETVSDFIEQYTER